MDTDIFELREATWEEFHQNTKDNFVEWGHPLNIDVYWQREVDSKDVVSNHRPWSLFLNGVIVASCETYGETSGYCLVESDEFKLHRGRSESVASVFVAVKYRGKGYATKMMRMLRERCQKEGAIFVDLYSDIDPIVYAKCGWYAMHDTTIIVKTEADVVDASLARLSKQTEEQLAKVKYITKSNYLDAHKIQLKHNYSYFEEKWNHYHQLYLESKNNSSNQDNTSVVPKYLYGKILTDERIEWHIAQILVYANFLKLEELPSQYGAILDDDCVIIWSHDFRDKELHIITVSARNKEQFQLLVDLAVKEANKYNLHKVKIWWNESSLLKKEYVEFINQTLVSRNGSVPMAVSWINPDSNQSAGVTNADTTNQGLMINVEKFNWV